MRAPSIELLRALRSAVSSTAHNTRLATTFSRTACKDGIRNPQPYRLRTTRTLMTSHRLRNPPPAPGSHNLRNPYAPTHTDRGPKSSEDTQTDFGAMDVLGNIPAPATSVDACTSDGFHLDNGVKTEGGRGIVLVGGEAFNWEPWWELPDSQTGESTKQLRISDMLDARRGILNIPPRSLGLLELLHPKPDLLIFGTGARLWMLSQECRKYVSEVLGCRVDVMDTANAAAAYNLLGKERGVEGGAGVGAVLLPIGWTGPKPQVAKRPGGR